MANLPMDQLKSDATRDPPSPQSLLLLVLFAEKEADVEERTYKDRNHNLQAKERHSISINGYRNPYQESDQVNKTKQKKMTKR